ncbi:MAG: PepSY domain-containing protein [Epsilonproteobacteria bacterium]|nr:PepSY domain-containing protein [Campylobacterota bacterium]
MRSFILVMHRYVGLSLSAFIIIAAITGSILAFNDELEHLISPELFIVDVPKSTKGKLDPLVLRELIHTAYPDIQTDYIPLRPKAKNESFYMSVFPKEHTKIDFDQVFINPYTGIILGTRMRGDLTQGKKNIMPFIYKMHYSLLLGDIGELIFGIIALIWTLDLLIVPYITLPKKSFRKHKLWLINWWQYAWRIKISHFFSIKKFIHTHRSIGLWLWPMLFIFAWSSVYFNLGHIYKPIMHSVFTYQVSNMHPKAEIKHPKLNFQQALEHARILMKDQAKKHHFLIHYEDFIGYFPERNVYEYFVNSTLDILKDEGKTRIYFDANDGTLLSLRIPTTKASSDTITSWITAIHMAAIGGIWFQVFIALTGIMIIILIFTGILLWLKKR